MSYKPLPRRQLSNDRWMISYADFLTLLLACFVVLVAIGSNEESAATAGASVARALGVVPDQRSSLPRQKLQRKSQTPPAELQKEMDYLRQQLAAEIVAGKLDVHLESRGVIVSLRETAFFGVGDDRINPSGYPQIDKIAAMLNNLPNFVRLEGHTDSTPIHTPRFRTNWELSTARSIAMMELLRDRYRIPAERLSVAGYADMVPADSNSSDAGRSHNRRVDIAILNQRAGQVEPARAVPPKGDATRQ